MVKRFTDRDRRRLWLHKDFVQLLKKKSVEQGVTVLEFSQAVEDLEVNPLRIKKR